MLNLRPKTLNLYINKSYECTERMNNKYYHELSPFYTEYYEIHNYCYILTDNDKLLQKYQKFIVHHNKLYANQPALYFTKMSRLCLHRYKRRLFSAYSFPCVLIYVG